MSTIAIAPRQAAASRAAAISLAWSGGLLAAFALLAARTYARLGR